MDKKKIRFIAIGVALAVVLAGVFWAKQYYDEHYVGQDYYTMVPLDYNMTSVDIYDIHGRPFATGIKYNLIAYDAWGRVSKEVEFIVYDPDDPYNKGETQPRPGTYLYVFASHAIVLNWHVLKESEVPTAALDRIKTQ